MKKLSKLLLALSFALSITSSAFAVTVASWGGAYTESQKLGYGDPTAKALGVDINWVDYSGGLSEIKAQKEAGAITWDIIDVFAFDTINGCDEGIFVEFDFDKDFPAAPDGTPASEDFFAPMPSKCAVGNILYSWNYAYDNRAFDGKAPKTIKDFFNTKKFPGKRAIYKSALTNLEIALAGDGVYMGKGGSEIYKLLETEAGVNRAMNKIKELCTDPNGGCVFWSAGAQQVWDGQGLDYEYFALVKGGPDEANAKKALAMMTNTEMLAGSAKYIAYAPYRLSSLEIIKANEPWYKDGKTEMMPQMPTAPANTKKYFLVDPFFWADNGTELGEKWEAMKAGL